MVRQDVCGWSLPGSSEMQKMLEQVTTSIDKYPSVIVAVGIESVCTERVEERHAGQCALRCLEPRATNIQIYDAVLAIIICCEG